MTMTKTTALATKMRTLCCIISLLCLLLSITVSEASKTQCMLPKTYDFEGALRRNLAAAERAQQRLLLIQKAQEENVYAKLRREKQELKQKQNEQEARRKREELRIQQEQERIKKQQQEEARRKHEEVRRKQEEARRKQQQQQQQRNKPNEKPCPYTILGVDKDATQAQIKSAYRKLAVQHHPDKNPGDEQARDMFTQLVDAYEILGDEDRRVMHDEESFGQYQSRPHNYNSKAGFYTGNSFVTALNQTEFDRLTMCKGPFREGESCEPFMIHFYTPWCVHCKNMISEWKRAASQMDGTETPLGYVNFAGVNCETNKQLCRMRGISSYPEVHLYAKGPEHMERFPSRKPRTVDNFIDFASQSIRLAHESNLQTLDAFLMDKNVTNSESTGLWVVMFENSNCPSCASLKASLRRMSANIGTLANFGILDCSQHAKTCQQQYVTGKRFPVLKLYPYKGVKGTGETLVEGSNSDPNVVLPIVEKVIRACLANLEAENGLMKTLHEEEEDEPPPPKQQYQYPEPERQTQRVLPAGVRASGGRQYIGN